MPLPYRALARIVSLLAVALALALVVSVARAQSAPTGNLTGRVLNQAANLSLENARITVAGTNREVFTNAFGEYRLTGLAPGNITLTVFSTGLVPQTTTVAVTAVTVAADALARCCVRRFNALAAQQHLKAGGL
jgi:hypothetical protein